MNRQSSDSTIPFQAIVESLLDVLQALDKRFPRALGDFVTHQDAQAVDLLPLDLESQQRTDLEIGGRDVQCLRVAAPVVQVS